MKFYRLIEKILLFCLVSSWRWFVWVHEIKNVRSKKKLIKRQNLTSEQKKLIDDFYLENYGRKVSYYWHRLYQSYTGNFDYRYFPEYLFSVYLEPMTNKRLEVSALEHKSLLTNIVGNGEYGARVPKTYVECVGGTFWDGERNIVSKDEACKILADLYEGTYQAIVKKTVDTSSGRDVRLIHVENGIDALTNETLETVLETMGDNFVVQEKILAHPNFAALYPGSINTLRVVSYLTSKGARVAPVLLRIGQKGYVDNAHAGGIIVGVTDEGKLLSEAYTEYQERYCRHPVTNVVFEDYQLPLVPEIIQTAKRLHKNLPNLRFVSWDFTVDNNSQIVVLEVNLCSQSVWMSQLAHGKSVFGDDTAEMLQLIKRK
ncbi:MAG: hypothetical protein IKU86_04065 [Thermoguttaceae bacterium]|nr:hypothetical protein [Thermoguttaceae bacterium]